MIWKLRLMFVGIVLLPSLLLVLATQNTILANDRLFNQHLAFSVAGSLIFAVCLPGLAKTWLLGDRIRLMRELCGRVKQGRYAELLVVPNEPRDGNDEEELTTLMRDMNWMARRIEMREQDLCRSRSRLKTMAMTDPLTEMPNRRCFFEMLQQAANPNGCGISSISMLILDVDHFKSINDTHGHQAGDRVLQELARIIGRNTRKTDLAARIGGEEYGLIMPGAGLPEATDTARRIQNAVFGHRFDLGDCLTISLTVSIGVCTMLECPCRVDHDKLYYYADQALYHSKRHGRNSISVFHVDTGVISKVA